MNSEHEQADALTQLNSALNLAKVMPPSKLKKNLIGLISLAPQIEDNLLEKVELPMGTHPLTQKSTPAAKTTTSSRPSTTGTGIPTDRPTQISTTSPVKVTVQLVSTGTWSRLGRCFSGNM